MNNNTRKFYVADDRCGGNPTPPSEQKADNQSRLLIKRIVNELEKRLFSYETVPAYDDADKVHKMGIVSAFKEILSVIEHEATTPPPTVTDTEVRKVTQDLANVTLMAESNIPAEEIEGLLSQHMKGFENTLTWERAKKMLQAYCNR